MTAQEPAPAPGEELSIALALANTRVSGTRGVVDRVREHGELEGWLRRRGLLGTADLTEREREDLLRLRDDARAVVESAGRRRAPERPALDRVNAAAAEPVQPVLTARGGALELQWSAPAAERPISRIARDLAVFAVSADAARVRTCAADDCDRLFVQDHGRRIWCSPGCGNRMRVKRHASRARAAQH